MIIEKKRTATETVDSMKIFIPDFTGQKQDPPVLINDMMEQFPSLDSEPTISVGIMHRKRIEFELCGSFMSEQKKEKSFEGKYSVEFSNGKIIFEGKEYENLGFYPSKSQKLRSENVCFKLKDVTIGIGFHWEQKEDQTFQGNLRFIPYNDTITAINDIGTEEYLTSVISSEMSATAGIELLKAHAVISRSWLLKPIFDNEKEEHKHIREIKNDEETIRWYERDAHDLFDVCADDHCQRYQGITRIQTENVRRAVESTSGIVLTYDGHICDARFSKACGGVTELFENCWENRHHNYLEKVNDSENIEPTQDLTIEENAQKWIRGEVESFCNTHDKNILSQVLNNYDRKTTDFYRWKVKYSTSEISELIALKSGIDFGEITDLIPIERGVSGRIVRLKIIGTKRSVTVGKELEIRKWLSTSHLYSSAFVVDKTADGFELTGAGWGHGVGLCQIGAAVMADKGYGYEEILQHYFTSAKTERIY